MLNADKKINLHLGRRPARIDAPCRPKRAFSFPMPGVMGKLSPPNSAIGSKSNSQRSRFGRTGPRWKEVSAGGSKSLPHWTLWTI